MFEILKKLNHYIEFYDVNSEEFASFGKIINNLDVSGIMEVASKIERPQDGSRT